MKDQVRAAYDAFEPDEATLDRMWAALEARVDAEVATAGGEGAAAGGEGAAASEAGGEAAGAGAGFAVTPGAKAPARRGGRARKWVPAVAAVLVVAVGVGAVVAANNGGRGAMAPTSDSRAYEVVQSAESASGAYPADDGDFDLLAVAGEDADFADFADNAADAESAIAADNATADSAAAGEFSPRTLIVSVEDGFTAADMQALCDKYGLSITYEYDNFAMFAVSLDHDAADSEMYALITYLSAEPGVLAVERDAIVHLDRP